MERYCILAFMLDRPGVLNKITMLIRRKMYNIDTLTVCSTNKPGVSRMTITLHSDDISKVEQVIKQIQKIIEVISAEILEPENSYLREVALVKIEMKASKLKSFKKNYNFEILEHENGTNIVQITGSIQEIDAFLETIGKENMIEVARTGVTAMKK